MEESQLVLGQMERWFLWAAAMTGALGTLWKAIRGATLWVGATLVARRARSLVVRAEAEVRVARESGRFGGAMSADWPVETQSWLDRAAARQLETEERAVVDGSHVFVRVSFLDPVSQRQLRGVVDNNLF